MCMYVHTYVHMVPILRTYVRTYVWYPSYVRTCSKCGGTYYVHTQYVCINPFFARGGGLEFHVYVKQLSDIPIVFPLLIHNVNLTA